MTRPKCYVFTGGGTGGHLTPGFAVAAELLRLEPDCRIVFAGTGREIERDMVARHGYEHVALPVESSDILRRRPWRFFGGNWRAWRLARRIVCGQQPSVVVGLGGFASVPLVLAAARAGRPTAILEQNVIPGRATQLLSRRVDAVCMSFDQTMRSLRVARRVEFTGNPVRPEISALCRENGAAGMAAAPDGRPTILILGGSQGAVALNEAVLRLVEASAAECRAFRFVHQTGPAQAAQVAAAYARLQIDCLVEPFFDSLAEHYSKATLVISRAGATTLAELACAGLPAVLVPYPHAAADHQRRNAEAYRRANAARLVAQQHEPSATAAALASEIWPLMRDADELASMSRAMHSLARPEAAARVVRVMQSLCTARGG